MTAVTCFGSIPACINHTFKSAFDRKFPAIRSRAIGGWWPRFPQSFGSDRGFGMLRIGIGGFGIDERQQIGGDAVDMAMTRSSSSKSRCVSSIFLVLPVLVVCWLHYVIGSCMRCYYCVLVIYLLVYWMPLCRCQPVPVLIIDLMIRCDASEVLRLMRT